MIFYRNFAIFNLQFAFYNSGLFGLGGKDGTVRCSGILAIYFCPFFGNNAGIVNTRSRQMFDTFVRDIKFNCDFSDAQYWGYFSICGLLMRYRDLFRSEQGLPPWAEFRRSGITEWIARKEARWPELESGISRTS